MCEWDGECDGELVDCELSFESQLGADGWDVSDGVLGMSFNLKIEFEFEI